MRQTLLYLSINLSIKSWNNWKSFLPRLVPPYPSRRSHLSGQKIWRKGVETHFLIEGKYFHQKVNTFYTKNSTIPTHPTRITLSNCLDWQFLPFSNQRWLLPLVLIDNHGWHLSSICFGLAMTPLSIHLDWLFLFLGNHRRNLFPFIWIEDTRIHVQDVTIL